MIVEIIGNINDTITNIEIDTVDYSYTSLSTDDKLKVDNFKTLISSKINGEKYLSINDNNTYIKLTFNGASINSDYYDLLDFNNLTDEEKSIINEIINI